jgi:hypothetical protein
MLPVAIILGVLVLKFVIPEMKRQNEAQMRETARMNAEETKRQQDTDAALKAASRERIKKCASANVTDMERCLASPSQTDITNVQVVCSAVYRKTIETKDLQQAELIRHCQNLGMYHK